MKSIWPCAGFMSFRPLYAQIELAFARAPVGSPEPEKATPGVPGGPFTSPARAALAISAATIAAQIAAASFLRIPSSLSPLGDVDGIYGGKKSSSTSLLDDAEESARPGSGGHGRKSHSVGGQEKASQRSWFS